MKWRSAFIQKDIIRDGNKKSAFDFLDIDRNSSWVGTNGNFVVDQSRDFS